MGGKAKQVNKIASLGSFDPVAGPITAYKEAKEDRKEKKERSAVAREEQERQQAVLAEENRRLQKEESLKRRQPKTSGLSSLIGDGEGGNTLG